MFQSLDCFEGQCEDLPHFWIFKLLLNCFWYLPWDLGMKDGLLLSLLSVGVPSWPRSGEANGQSLRTLCCRNGEPAVIQVLLRLQFPAVPASMVNGQPSMVNSNNTSRVPGSLTLPCCLHNSSPVPPSSHNTEICIFLSSGTSRHSWFPAYMKVSLSSLFPWNGDSDRSSTISLCFPGATVSSTSPLKSCVIGYASWELHRFPWDLVQRGSCF